jgi:drug/metabolite transporter (DMT)-like permease
VNAEGKAICVKHFYILGTVLFTVYGQLILKWRIGNYGVLPDALPEKVCFLLRLLADGYILSGFLAAFVASLFWMAAMTNFELSYAYPFMSLNFVMVLLLSGWLLGEPVTLQRTLGVGMIVAGTIVAARA